MRSSARRQERLLVCAFLCWSLILSFAPLVGTAEAADNDATTDLATDCRADRTDSTGSANGAPTVAIGESVRLVSAVSFGEGTIFQDVLTRPDGTSFFASQLSLTPDPYYLSFDPATVSLNVNGTPTALAVGSEPRAASWVLDTTTTAGSFVVYFPGEVDSLGAGQASWVTPAGGGVVTLAIDAIVAEASPGDPTNGQTFNVLGCATSVANGVSNQTIDEQTVSLTLAEPNLQITKIPSVSLSAPGGSVTYDVEISNPPSDDPTLPVATAYDVVVSDVPDQTAGPVTFLSSSPTAVWDGTRVVFDVGPIPPGERVSLSYTLGLPSGLDPAASTPVGNEITVSGTGVPGIEPTERTYSASADAEVIVGIAPVSAIKISDTTGAPIDGVVSYRLTGTFPANVAWFDAVIWDELPDGLDLLTTPTVNCTGCTGAEQVPQLLGPVVLTDGRMRIGYSLGDLGSAPNDRDFEIKYDAAITAEDSNGLAPVLGQEFTNHLHVGANLLERSGGVQPNLLNPPSEDSIAVDDNTVAFERPILTVTKSTLTDPVSPDDEFMEFEVAIENSGNAEAVNVWIRDNWQTYAQAPVAGWAPGLTWSTVRFVIDSIPAGETFTFTYRVPTQRASRSVFDNQAFFQRMNDGNGFLLTAAGGTDRSLVSTRVLYPELTIEKRPVLQLDSTTTAAVEWDLTITNVGTALAHSVRLTDTPQTGVLGSASLVPGSDPKWSGSNSLFAYADPIPPGSSVQVRITTPLAPGTPPGVVTNSAVVDYQNADGRTAVYVVEDSANLVFTAQADAKMNLVDPSISITKRPDSTDNPTPIIVQGGFADFTIVVANTGSVPITDFVVSDDLPATLEYNFGAATTQFVGTAGWIGAAPVAAEEQPIDPALPLTSTNWTINVLPPGASLIITLPVTQNGDAPSENELVNEAVVTGGQLSAVVPPWDLRDDGTLLFQPSIDPPTQSKTSEPAVGAPGTPTTWTVEVIVPSNSIDLYDVTNYDVLPDGFEPAGAATIESCVGGCPAGSLPLDPIEVVSSDGLSGHWHYGFFLGDIPAGTAPSTYTIEIPTVVAAEFRDGVQVLDGVREPIINRTRTYYNMVSDQADPAAGDASSSDPAEEFERRTTSSISSFDIQTPNVEVVKSIRSMGLLANHSSRS